MNSVEQASIALQLDRRSHARVQDAVGLRVKRSADVAAVELSEAPLDRRAPTKHDKYGVDGYTEVRNLYPAVADYVGELEQRIRDLLPHGDGPPLKPTHKVSLSSGGLYFADKMLLRPGEQISLTITLFPTGRQISADARIVAAKDAEGVSVKGNLNYRASFTRMSDADRLFLEKHIEQLLAKSTLLDS